MAVGDYVNSSDHQTALYMTLASGKWLATTMLQPLDAASGTGQRSGWSPCGADGSFRRRRTVSLPAGDQLAEFPQHA